MRVKDTIRKFRVLFAVAAGMLILLTIGLVFLTEEFTSADRGADDQITNRVVQHILFLDEMRSEYSDLRSVIDLVSNCRHKNLRSPTRSS